MTTPEPEAGLGARLAEHLALVAEEILEERIVGERRRLAAPPDLDRRDVGDRLDGLRGHPREVGAAHAAGGGDGRRRGRLLGDAARRGSASTSSRSSAEPDSTMPATSPVTSSRRDEREALDHETSTRRGAASAAFGTVMVSTPSRISATIVGGVHGQGQKDAAAELAVAAFDLVILLARHARFAAALQGQLAVADVDANLFAGHARQFGGQDIGLRRFRRGRWRGSSPAARSTSARADAGWSGDRGMGPSEQTPRCLAS